MRSRIGSWEGKVKSKKSKVSLEGFTFFTLSHFAFCSFITARLSRLRPVSRYRQQVFATRVDQKFRSTGALHREYLIGIPANPVCRRPSRIPRCNRQFLADGPSRSHFDLRRSALLEYRFARYPSR